MSHFSQPTKPRCCATILSIYLAFYETLLLGLIPSTGALHHMKRAPLQYVSQRDESRPLVVSNLCKEDIYPGVLTQSGTAPKLGGFQLTTGQTVNLTVSADWQGRVWGRTNCSFNAAGTGPKNNGGYDGYGRSCGTGDCNGVLNCQVPVGIESQRYPNLQENAEARVGGHTRDARRVHSVLFQRADLLRHFPC